LVIAGVFILAGAAALYYKPSLYSQIGSNEATNHSVLVHCI
jgi:hypothetical protein